MNRKIGVNGFGRVGKLLVWNLIASGNYKEIVINTATPNTSIDQIANYLEKDSTYGRLSNYAKLLNSVDIKIVPEEKTQSISIYLNPLENYDSDGGNKVIEVKLIFFFHWKNPMEIPWEDYDIRIVVDATGMFLDPFAEGDSPAGSLRGHLEAGARKVVVTAPFQLKEGIKQPEDCVTTIMGINENDYNPERHYIISVSSCTTTCLAHMIKPFFHEYNQKNILSISMVTIHALTSAQPALDLIPDGGLLNERFYRSALNNIILTSTGATKSIRQVIPEMEDIGFIAQSVRVPVSTGSLIIMTINIQDSEAEKHIRINEKINAFYQKEAEMKGSYISYSKKPHVSEDIRGLNKAVLIEGRETHSRTAEATIATDSEHAKGGESCPNAQITIPVTQATIYGWYDNEMGNFVYMLSKNLDYIFEKTYTLHN